MGDTLGLYYHVRDASQLEKLILKGKFIKHYCREETRNNFVFYDDELTVTDYPLLLLEFPKKEVLVADKTKEYVEWEKTMVLYTEWEKDKTRIKEPEFLTGRLPAENIKKILIKGETCIESINIIKPC
jgi:hypothetical protein